MGGLERVDRQVFAGAAVLALLNLLDGLFTLTFLQLGWAEEANPLMRLAYEQSPLGFMMFKLSVVHGGIAVLWFHRAAIASRIALYGGIALYGAIVAYHLVFCVTVLRI